MGFKKLSLKDDYRIECNYDKGRLEFHFDTKKCIAIVTVILLVAGGFGVNKYLHNRKNKKIEDLKEKLNQSMVVNNGDGTQSTSVAKGLEDKTIIIKEDMTNHGKQIMFTHHLKPAEVEELQLIYKEELSWGGSVEVVNNADISFEYLSNPGEFKVERLKSGAYHVQISKDNFEARALLNGKELVKTKLSAGGKLEQALDFKKNDFVKEAQNKAEVKIREDAQSAAEKSLDDSEIQEKLYKSATNYYTKFLEKFGERVYITYE